MPDDTVAVASSGMVDVCVVEYRLLVNEAQAERTP